MNSEQWNAAIFDWYFGSHVANRPVYLSVDDAALRLIASNRSWDSVDPVAELRAALRIYLEQDRPFGYWDRLAQRWEHDGGMAPPPFVHLLALTVLPASERRNDDSAGGYYGPLFSILGIADTAARREDYRWNVPSLWRRLGKWLDSRGGSFGLPTAREGSHATAYLGWSTSQAIIRSADRAAFIDFFEQAGYRPGEHVSGELLLARFERWSSQSRISERARRALTDPVLRSAFAEILRHDLATWTGEARDDDFRPVLRVLPRLNARRQSVTAVLVCGEAFGGLTVGGSVVADPGDHSVFLQIPITLQPKVWRQNFEVDGTRLQLRHAPVLAFEEDMRMGGYTAVDRMTDGRTAWLAIADSENEVVDYLRARRHRLERWDSLPNWQIVRDVRIEPEARRSAPGALQSVLPALGVRATLRGGLALGNRRYMPGGAPDLVVPESPLPVGVHLDDQHIASSRESHDLVLRLASVAASVGRHSIEVGDQSIHFEIEDHTAANPSFDPLCHVVLPNPPTLLNLCAENLTLPDEQTISGATIRFRTEHEPVTSLRPAVEGWVLFGPNGESTSLPAHPAWLDAIDQTSCHFAFDDLAASAIHPVLWVARVMSGRVHISLANHAPTDEVDVEPLECFGERRVLLPRELVTPWTEFRSGFVESKVAFPGVGDAARQTDRGSTGSEYPSADQMLEWCSTRCAGSIATFVETYQWLTDTWHDRSRAYRVLRNLNRLGHVEVDWHGQRWTITRPIVVQPFNSGGLAFLTGQRSARLGEVLDALVVDLDLDAVLTTAKQFVEAPRLIAIRSSGREQLQSLAVTAGLDFVANLSSALGELLPTVDRMVRRGRAPGGFERRRISIGDRGLELTPEFDDSWNGSYEHDSFGPMVYSIKESALDDDLYLVDRSTAVWYALRAQGKYPVKYDEASRVLAVRADFGLPLLHERAMIMASGLLPSIERLGDHRHYVYRNVSPTLASHLKETLT